MDDLDKFLEESGVTVTSTTDRTLSIEKDDDFLAFLDTAGPLPSTIGNKDGGSYAVSTQAIDDGQDFLEWLQDSPRKNSTELAQETRAWSPNASFIETSKHLHTDIKDVSKESMDSFFNDVFGSPSPSTKSRKNLEEEESQQTFEEQVLSIVQSSFPDVLQLKRIICEAGYIPNKLRAQVWSLLLNESCVEDEECRHYHTEGSDFEGQEALRSDCSAVISSATPKLSAAEAEAARKDMHDILVLYCQRRSIAYSSILCRLLSPLLVVPERASRTMASSCFYTLASDFVPFINLNPVAYQLAVGVSHSWLRVLLGYHCPALLLHLDRVLPHWQEPAAELSAHQSVRHVATQKRNTELDELERELGLDVLDDLTAMPPPPSSAEDPEVGGSNPSQSSNNNKDSFIESAMPHRETGRYNHSIGIMSVGSGVEGGNSSSSGGGGRTDSGCVPTHWIVGIFTGSLPPEQAALLLDWVIVNNAPFAGLYLSVALLEIFSQSLLKMSGPRIRQWFEDVALNKADWYRSLSVSVPAEVSKSVKLKGGSDAQFLPDSWAAFTTGWIHCTRALIRSTPQAFKDGLENTSQWAQLRSEHRGSLPGPRVLFNNNNSNNNTSHSRINHELDAQVHGHSSSSNSSSTSSIQNTTHGQTGSNSSSCSNQHQQQQQEEDESSVSTGDDSGAEEEEDGSEDDNYIEDSIFDSPDTSMRLAHPDAPLPQQGSAMGTGFGTTNFMAQFRRLSAHLYQQDNSSSGPQSPFPHSPGKKALLQQFPQERAFISKVAPICVSASAAEVVPCICSNRRRATVPDDLISCFYSAAFSTSSGGTDAPRVLTPPTQQGQQDENRPFYFGIDCRSAQEREMGQFPKAYAFDPADLAEGEEVNKLLDMVETMAASAHLCLIGAGDDFLRWAYDRQQGNRSNSSTSSMHKIFRAAGRNNSSRRGGGGGYGRKAADPPELQRCIEESHSKLNAVAMFFLKRSFKHISILDGGFMAAARYLQAPDSPLSLTAALVDCNRPALESLLGITTTAATTTTNATGTKRDSIVGFLAETTVSAPSKLLSVGTYFTSNKASGSSGGGGTSTESSSSLPSSGSFNNLTTQVSTAAASHGTTSTNTTSANTPTTAAATSGGDASAAAATATEGNTLFGGWGKKISMLGSSSLETLKKGVATVSVAASAAGLTGDVASGGAAVNGGSSSNAATGGGGGADKGGAQEDDDGDDGMGPKEIPDSTKINISRTEKEREQALSLHKMAGLRKGDKVMINRTDLPGAILFPSIKYKEVMVEVPLAPVPVPAPASVPEQDAPASDDVAASTTTAAATAGDSTTADSSSAEAPDITDTTAETSPTIATSTTTSTATATPVTATTTTTKVAQQVQVHRYLVVSRERFIVLDASGGGVGSEATVKSNRHLTELMKMTFKKKDPELVTLFFVSPTVESGKPRQYRVSKRQEFVTALQVLPAW